MTTPQEFRDLCLAAGDAAGALEAAAILMRERGLLRSAAGFDATSNALKHAISRATRDNWPQAERIPVGEAVDSDFGEYTKAQAA